MIKSKVVECALISASDRVCIVRVCHYPHLRGQIVHHKRDGIVVHPQLQLGDEIFAHVVGTNRVEPRQCLGEISIDGGERHGLQSGNGCVMGYERVC